MPSKKPSVGVKKESNYNQLIDNIAQILEQGRKQSYAAVNKILVKTYWEIGKRIVEYEQEGKEKAEYGTALLDHLSRDLKLMHGKGFSKSNVYLMRQFYLKYKKFQTVSGKLSWSVNHADIGQMNMYLNYFKEEENSPKDNEPIGIILSAEKNHFLVKYTIGGLSNKLFVSKYKLYLPDTKQLEQQLNKLLKES